MRNQINKTSRKGMDNKKMNPETYVLRRKVIDIIYDLKEIIALPRIRVRITDDSVDSVLAVARMNKDSIWVSERAINYGKNGLKHIVVHEIAHAVFGLPHDKKCPVMSPVIKTPATDIQISKFLKTLGAN